MAGLDDLARATAQFTGETIVNSKRVIDGAFAMIEELCAGGEKVVIRGFGTFSNRTTAAHKGKNPQTGKDIQIPEKTKLVFKRSKNAE